MSTPASTKNNLTKRLFKQLPGVSFVPGKEFYWSPKEKIIYYIKSKLERPSGQWTLLHEAAHAKLKHQDYTSDLELLLCEVTAWDEATKMASALDISIDSQHIQNCLDTYRDWLYARSKCPVCQLNGLQTSPRQYQCLNCLNVWQVSSSRFCRPYRMQKFKY